MSSSSRAYHEALLHWIWENHHFDFHRAQTEDGNNITIHKTGQHNKSDGPDFKGAEISIEKLRWYGDVEIHWNLKDWLSHGHQGDPNFEQVILHVVFDKTEQKIYRDNGSPIPTLVLSSYLDAPLYSFLEQYRQTTQLPCSGQVTFISEDAFAKQIQKAHKEYFEQKVDDLLKFYDPSLVPSQAWLKMLSIALFDGLGISHNREPMRRLAKSLFSKKDQFSSIRELKEQAINISGIKKQNSTFTWHHKGIRPGNHPKPRILQAADCLWYMMTVPFETWIQTDPAKSWGAMIDSISVSPSIGRERGGILFGTVFLPAIYSLGNLFFNEKLKTKSWNLWQKHQVSLPSSLLYQLEQSELSPGLYAKKLGTIYQLRNYCNPKNCQDCKVFKSIISS